MDSTASSQHPSYRDKTILHEYILWVAVWSILGTAAMVIAYSIGWLANWSAHIRGVLSAPPFLLSDSAATVPPLSIFLISLSVTLFFTHSLLGIRELGMRLLILAAATVLVSLCTPVCALWNVFLSPGGILLSLVVSGLGASVTAAILQRHQDARSIVSR